MSEEQRGEATELYTGDEVADCAGGMGTMGLEMESCRPRESTTLVLESCSYSTHQNRSIQTLIVSVAVSPQRG